MIKLKRQFDIKSFIIEPPIGGIVETATFGFFKTSSTKMTKPQQKSKIKRTLKLRCADGHRNCWVRFEVGEHGEVWVWLKNHKMKRAKEVVFFPEDKEKIREWFYRAIFEGFRKKAKITQIK